MNDETLSPKGMDAAVEAAELDTQAALAAQRKKLEGSCQVEDGKTQKK